MLRLSPPIRVVACVLLAVAAVGSGCGDVETSTETPQRPKDGRPTDKRAPLRTITGTVRNPMGPIPNATVFVLDKKLLGGDRSGLPHVVSDAKGRFRIRTRKIDNHWLGVVHEHYTHGHFDLSTWDGSTGIGFVLKPARRVVVTVVGDKNVPVSNQVVMLTPWPPADQFQLPGPGFRQGERTAITDSRGRANFWVGSPGPVTIRPELDGLFPDPSVLDLAADEQVGLVRARSGVRFPRLFRKPHPPQLDGVVRDPYQGSLEISWYRNGDLIRTRDLAVDASGRPKGRFAPGTFDLRVSSTQGGTMWMRGVVFDEDAADMPARPSPKATGTLRLNSGPARQTWLRRRGGPQTWDAVGGTQDAYSTHALEAGSYDVLVLDASGSRMCGLADVRVVADTESMVPITCSEGTWFLLRKLTLPADTRRLLVEHERFGRLPLIGRTGTRTRVGLELFHLHRARKDAKVELGPYPAGKITVRGTR